MAAAETTDGEGVPTADTESARAFRDAVAMLDSLDIDEKQMVVRAFTSFFHLANLSEENYRVETLLEREREVSIDSAIDSSNELTVAYDQLVREMGGGPATQLLAKLEFHPVFTAHPTEARRKADEEGARIVAAAREKAEGEREAILQDARHQVALLSIAITEKMLRERLDDEASQTRLAEKMLDEMESRSERKEA